VSSTFPRAVGIALSVRPVLKRAGLPVEDCLPWDEVRFGSFGTMDDVPLPETQSFGVLEDGDEAWPELEEWLELHPDEPEDLPLDGTLLPQAGAVNRTALGPRAYLRRLPVR